MTAKTMQAAGMKLGYAGEAGDRVLKVLDEGGAVVGMAVREGMTAPFFPQLPVYRFRAGKAKRGGVVLPGGAWVLDGGGWCEYGKWHSERGGDAEKLLAKYQRRSNLVVSKKERDEMRGDKKPQTFRLSAGAAKALEMLAFENRLTKTEVLEKLLVGEMAVKSNDSLSFMDAVVGNEEVGMVYRQGEVEKRALRRVWKLAGGVGA